MTTPPTPSTDNPWKPVAEKLANALGKLILTNSIHPSLLKIVFGAIEEYVKVATESAEAEDWWANTMKSSPSQTEWDKFMAEHHWPTEDADDADTDDIL